MSLPSHITKGETYARLALALTHEGDPTDVRLAAITAWLQALDAAHGDAKAARILIDRTFTRLEAAHRAAETVLGV